MFAKVFIFVLMLGFITTACFASAQHELDAATKVGKAAFILVYDQTAVDVEQSRQMISGALAEYPNAVKIEVDRGNPAEADFVTQYKLSSAPVPIILVAARTGTITGGAIAKQTTIEQLVKMIPSPKKTEVIKALSEGNAVLITASRKGMKTIDTVNNICAMACQKIPGKSVQVKIDMDDPAESAFLAEMRVNLVSAEPVTMVANAQGQIAGVYSGAVQVADLVTAATKKVGGCCPKTVSNPNAACPPTKK